MDNLESPASVKSAVNFFNSLTRSKSETQTLELKNKRPYKSNTSLNEGSFKSLEKESKPKSFLVEISQEENKNRVTNDINSNEVTNDGEKLFTQKSQILETQKPRQKGITDKIVIKVPNNEIITKQSQSNITNNTYVIKVPINKVPETDQYPCSKSVTPYDDDTKQFSEDSENELLLRQSKPKYKRNHQKNEAMVCTINDNKHVIHTSRSFDKTETKIINNWNNNSTAISSKSDSRKCDNDSINSIVVRTDSLCTFYSESHAVSNLHSSIELGNKRDLPEELTPLLEESQEELGSPTNEMPLDLINSQMQPSENVKVDDVRKSSTVVPKRKSKFERQLSMTNFRVSESVEVGPNEEIRKSIKRCGYRSENLPDVAVMNSSDKLRIDENDGSDKVKLRRKLSPSKPFYRKTNISEYMNKSMQQRIGDCEPEKFHIQLVADKTDDISSFLKSTSFTESGLASVSVISNKESNKDSIAVTNSDHKCECDKPNKPKVPPRTFINNEDVFKSSNKHARSSSVTRRPRKKPGVEQKQKSATDYAGLRSDVFLEPYLQGLGDRHNSPGVGAPSPSPPPCRIAPCLLPAPASRSLSRESLVSSNGGGSEAGSEDSTDTGYGATCDINLVERLIRSHPIWFLPGIQRAGAFHLLQGKEEGCFVVRQSSQPDTMALSVRLPPDKGPYIEHYLIQSSEGRLGLETSENRFDNMPALIAHYANCCDELPVQLTLPKAIREAKTRQQLSSLALLGQEFWRYSPPPSASSSPDVDLVLNLNPLLSTFKKAEPSTPTGDAPKPTRPNTLNLVGNVDTPKSDSQLVKSTPLSSKSELSKVPPPPPPRWSKPTTPQSNFATPQNNFTVTTTVTFSVKSESPRSEAPPPQMDVVCDPKRMSPEGQCNSTVSSKDSSLRRGPDQVMSPNGSVLSPLSDPSSLLSPDTLSPLSATKTGRHSKRAKHKISKHYQESDILDSPTVYYRSAVGDKISDYEDLWTNDHSTFKPRSHGSNNNNCNNLPSPDLIQHTQNVVSLNNNILSPADSHSSSQRSTCCTPVTNQNSHNQNSVQSPTGESPNNSGLGDPTNCQSPKQGSPFYAEPADSLAPVVVPRRIIGRNLVPMQQRHSNPPALHLHSSLSPGLERIDSPELNGTISSSVGNLSPKQKPVSLKKPEAKAVQPPLIKPRLNENWTIDNSWKFVVNENDVSMDSSDADYESDWPSGPPQLPLSPHTVDTDERITIQDLIARRFPDIRTSTEITTDEDISRISAYDNVDDKTIPRAPPSEISEITEFSDPWNEVNQGFVCTETDDTLSDNCNPPSRTTSITRSKSFKDRLDPLLAAPRLQALRNREQGYNAVGAAIRQYALELSQDKSTTFAQNIDNFIACTCESKEVNPQVVMRNMRQFMSGMKNYLVKHGEKGFNKEVEKERNKLKSTEFLNLDAILEGVMHKLVVRPLKGHLQKLFVDHFTKTGDIRLLADNIQYANTRPISELAIKPKISLPTETALQTISQYLQRLQAADSPLEKLEYLLASIATIFNSVKSHQISGSGRAITLGADDFLPLFVWVLVKTNFVAAEIEAEYMWGLLHPSLLSGEGGYYLTTLSSAVHVLKNFKESSEENTKNHIKNDSVLKVIVPDELHGSILTKTLPARPHMTTKEVCKIIAHKARITNPQDYALYRLVDGEETILGDNECPQDFMHEGKHVRLAYKRIDAKIAWPKQQSN